MQKPAPPAPPPTVVTVSQPITQQVSDYVEFTGTTQAVASVDLRARVKGFLQKIDFREGAIVNEGDLLFEIQPDTFQADVDAANAAVAAAQAQLQKNDADLQIKQEMAAGNAASKLDVIQAQAAVYVATASVQSAQAQLEMAKINLGYTKVYAPITGKIDRSQVDVGNLVGSDGNTLLANIVQISPIYFYFNVDEATVQRFLNRAIAKGMVPGSKNPNYPFTLALGDTGEFQFEGIIDYIDNKVDPSTGTVQVRGVLKNEDRALLPGFFARVRVPDGDPYQAILVPQRAIGVDQGQKYVLVVNDKNVVEMRPIETGSVHGLMTVITKGITKDDWVITEGILRTRPGATVSPQKQAISSVETGQPDTNPSTTQPQP